MAKIEKNVPIPPGPDRKMKYPWLELGVGDSFLIETSLDVAKINARQASARYKKKFKARVYQGKVRIWRIE